LLLGRTEPNEAESAPRPPPAFSLIEGYRCVRKLGEGGMGAVYLAEDKTLGRHVAIKLISAALSDDAATRSRFLREARAMATVEHPHVVRIYSYGESKGLVYLVMEYVQGESLADRLRRLGKLTVEESLQVVAQAADALDAAWQKGIVHRDIKPANIMLDARDRVRVADFGLAKSVDAARPTCREQRRSLPDYLRRLSVHSGLAA
jgi:serine/threonine-protein kinase